MCTRDWQRHDIGAERPATVVPGSRYLTVLQADGTFARTPVGCTCSRSVEAAAMPADGSRPSSPGIRLARRTGRQLRSLSRGPLVMRLQRGASPG